MTVNVIDTNTLVGLKVGADVYNDNFSDPTNAASKEVGTLPENVPLNSDLGTSSTADTGLLSGQVPTADDLSMVGETVNWTKGNYDPLTWQAIGHVVLAQNLTGGNIPAGTTADGSLLRQSKFTSVGAITGVDFLPTGYVYINMSWFTLVNEWSIFKRIS